MKSNIAPLPIAADNLKIILSATFIMCYTLRYLQAIYIKEYLGKNNFEPGQRRKEIPVSEYAFHFQTQWRFTDDKSIVLGSRDIYEPYNCAVPDDWEYDIIGRTDEESSILGEEWRFIDYKTIKHTIIWDIEGYR